MRRSWRIAPERARITGKRWKATRDEIVARAVSRLGVCNDVEAQFHKLPVYETSMRPKRRLQRARIDALNDAAQTGAGGSVTSRQAEHRNSTFADTNWPWRPSRGDDRRSCVKSPTATPPSDNLRFGLSSRLSLSVGTARGHLKRRELNSPGAELLQITPIHPAIDSEIDDIRMGWAIAHLCSSFHVVSELLH